MTIRRETFTTFSAPALAAWEIIAQTDKLNREMGIPAIEFSFVPRTSGGSGAWAKIKYAGQTFRYREHPFEWVVPRFHVVRRTFQKGPFTEIRGGIELEETNGQTKVKV